MNTSKSSTTLLWFIPLLLVPSGCAALIFQVTWVRLLGLSMGSTSAAVSTVLAAFFLGMAIGSFLAGKLSKASFSDLKTFAFLELFIGISGLLLVPIFLNLEHLMVALGDIGSLLSVKFAISLLILAIPTICMGATYPILATALVRQQDKMNSDLGKLYTLNTLGAILGALISGFILIPRLGIDGAVYVASGLNLCTVLAAYVLYKNTQLLQQSQQPLSVEEAITSAGSVNLNHHAIALVLFCTGFTAIASEVAWTKYLSIITGATIYGFSAILGIFLSGITLGSWLSGRYIRLYGASIKLVIRALMALAAALLIARVGLAQMPAILEFLNSLSIFSEHQRSWKYLTIFVVLFPATFIFGALFPVLLSLYCAQLVNLKKRIGRGYAINTAGSIIGSIAAGFWIIPVFGTDTLLSITIIIILILVVTLFKQRLTEQLKLFTLAALLMVGVWQLPHLDYVNLLSANFYGYDADTKKANKPNFLYIKEGKTGVISIVSHDNVTAILQNNGNQESFLVPKNGPPPAITEVLLGLMPYFLHTNPTTAFVVGFGGGNTVQALANTPIKKIRVTELEPAVISAVSSIYGGEIPLLQDQRIELQINDARNSLLVEDQKYDLIISQPSHPWLAGAGNLFTKEFFEIVANKLNDDGIYTQWVNLFKMDATTLRSIIKAYYEVFPHGLIFAKSSNLIMFGSNQKMEFNYQRIKNRMAKPAIKKSLAAATIYSPEALLWYFALSRKEALELSEGIKANTDKRIVTEVRLADISSKPKGKEDPYQLIFSKHSFDVSDYLTPDTAAATLYLTAQYFQSRKMKYRTTKAIEQLKKINPELAEKLISN